MTDREFVTTVRERAGLPDDRAAQQAAAAVVGRLVGRLSWREKYDLAAALPPKLRRITLAASNTGLAYAPASSFVAELADDLQVTRAQAREIARAVASVLAELLPPEEMRDLRAELRSTYDAVFA